jgi:hypothetical protein
VTPIRFWIALPLLIAAGPTTAAHGQEAASGVDVRTVRQGEVIALTFPARDGAQPVSPDALVGRFQGREVPAFSDPGGVAVLLGVDMEDAPGTSNFVLERGAGEESRVVERVPITVTPGDFGVQTLALPDKQVDLDSETLRRVETEQRTMLTAMQRVTPRAWDGAFILPSDGSIQNTFGLRRVINGQPRRPHTGEDISAPAGAPVSAINHGTVRLVADHFFSGKSVVIDHGLGLYSMYFHLSNVTVHVGDRVAKSQVIGAVGSTGRASGPHLHWGVRLNGARVNPLSLPTAPVSLGMRGIPQ